MSTMHGDQEQRMKLEDLQATAAVRGILSDGLVTVVSVQWFGSEALELTYKTPTGKVANGHCQTNEAGPKAPALKD